MGSQSRAALAYIAGFLDGDGSLMLQIKKRKDGRLRRRFMCTICFYQDSRHEHSLRWIRDMLGIGYISRRNDGITELRINGFRQVRDIMARLLPFVRFKQPQAKALLAAARILSRTDSNRLSTSELVRVVDCIEVIQSANYVTRKKRSRRELYRELDLTP
mgnify:FL=1